MKADSTKSPTTTPTATEAAQRNTDDTVKYARQKVARAVVKTQQLIATWEENAVVVNGRDYERLAKTLREALDAHVGLKLVIAEERAARANELQS